MTDGDRQAGRTSVSQADGSTLDADPKSVRKREGDDRKLLTSPNI